MLRYLVIIVIVVNIIIIIISPLTSLELKARRKSANPARVREEVSAGESALEEVSAGESALEEVSARESALEEGELGNYILILSVVF